MLCQHEPFTVLKNEYYILHIYCEEKYIRLQCIIFWIFVVCCELHKLNSATLNFSPVSLILSFCY